MIKALGLFVIFLLFFSCSTHELRGFTEKNKDATTYLIIEPDSGGGELGPVYVDHKLWPYKVGEAGRIEPGSHCLGNSPEDCSINFEVKPNTTFHFDYWGP